MENISLFFKQFNRISIWKLIFSWKKFKSLYYQGKEEFILFREKYLQADKMISDLYRDKTTLKSETDNLKERINKSESRLELLVQQYQDTKEDLAGLKSIRDKEVKEHNEKISEMLQAKEKFDVDRQKIAEAQVGKEKEYFEEMKRTWNRHEKDVENTIKNICHSHVIEYCEKVSFRGNPDNAIKICDEYIVFDAKSPQSNDLENFPTYIRSQADKIKKYTKLDEVKKDIYLVVPTNTIELLKESTIDRGDYKVYVISKDSLEPVILSLKKIEEYEFIDTLSPEDRQSIVRVLGKFYHANRRRVQIDQWMTLEILEILKRCETDLPEEFYDAVMDIDKAGNLNAPAERRHKQVSIQKLENKQKKVESELHANGIDRQDENTKLSA